MTQRKSFEKLDEWLKSFTDARGQQELLLVGNKMDLKGNIKIKENEVKAYANSNNMKFILTSAKTGDNVENAFLELIKSILKALSVENNN